MNSQPSTSHPQPSTLNLQLPPSALIFDLGNTLIRFDERRFATRMAARTGRSLEELAVYFHQSPLVIKYTLGRMTSEDFVKAVSHDLNFPGTFAEFSAIWCEIFEPMDEMLALAMRLKGRVPRVILSNTNALHVDYLYRQYPILHEFDGQVFSQVAGLLKPDVRIYEHTLRQYGFEAARTVLIDDLAPNLEGARKAGLPGIQCLNATQVRQELTKLGVPFI